MRDVTSTSEIGEHEPSGSVLERSAKVWGPQHERSDSRGYAYRCRGLKRSGCPACNQESVHRRAAQKKKPRRGALKRGCQHAGQ